MVRRLAAAANQCDTIKLATPCMHIVIKHQIPERGSIVVHCQPSIKSRRIKSACRVLSRYVQPSNMHERLLEAEKPSQLLESRSAVQQRVNTALLQSHSMLTLSL